MDSGRLTWASVSPSTAHSVAYLKSPLLTSATSRHGKTYGVYLALLWMFGDNQEWARGYLVRKIESPEPLPKSYVPVFSAYGPRLAVEPRFPWRHGPCVLDTFNIIVVQSVFVSPIPPPESPNCLDPTNASLVESYFDEDYEAELRDYVADIRPSRLREMKEAGVNIDELGDESPSWASFGTFKSRRACAAPGAWEAPASISARVSFDVETLQELLSRSQLDSEIAEIERIRARLSRSSATQLMYWRFGQSLCGIPDNPLLEEISDLENPALKEICADLSDPDPEPEPVAEFDEEGYPVYSPADDLVYTRMSRPSFPDKGFDWLPPISPADIQIVYVDLYGTLIDDETGIYNGLITALNQVICPLSRSQALTLYFDIEDDLKRRLPGSPYVEILAKCYEEFHLRLGLNCEPGDIKHFVESFFEWPLFSDAIQSMSQLKPTVLVLAGVVDVDGETLSKCAAFRALQPYFTELLTWDAVRCYRPCKDLYDRIFRYHDTSNIPRACWTIISGSLFQDIEAVRSFGVPGMWVRRWGTLTANFQERTCIIKHAWAICGDVLDAVTRIVLHKALPSL
ncbi:unnamed protein product [Mycena citricolor]|uniref:Uncharacterized protein n=1 Tax=Mycena citricolor TaxID=2018698 RepID=A0AAD2H8A6_9AGAR|nr:unnamed protein product [Mycena citricolor]